MGERDLCGEAAVRRLALFCVVGVLCLGVRPAVAVAPVAPIRVYIFAGQSNMTGAATMAAQLPAVAPALQIPKNAVSFFGPTSDMPRQWAPLQAPTEVLKNIFREGFGPELSAGRALSDLHPGERIAILKFAWNGTNLHRDWNPDRTHGLYSTSMSVARHAMDELAASTKLPLRISGFFWMQGESDSDTWAHADAYGRNLEGFIARVRHDLHTPNLPFLIGQIDDVRKYHPVLLGHSAIVRAEQRRVARADPYAFLVSTEGLGHNAVSPIHFNTEGTVELGRRFVQRSFGL